MAEESKPPEGGDKTAEAELAKVKAELEAAKAEALREKSEREKLESIRKELEDTRQAAKDRERKALEEQGQFKTIAEKTQAELDAIKAEAAAAKERAEAAEAKLKAQEDAERAAILESIPESDRQKWKDRPLEVLRDVAPIYASQGDGKSGAHKGAPARPHNAGNKKKYSEMSPEERTAFIESASEEEIAEAMRP